MFKEIAIVAMLLCVVHAAPLQDEQPTPYEFAFEEKNENHTLARQEAGDGSGVVKGQYTLIDRDGRQRTVVYIADPVNGFSAQIQSNEPGLINSAPAAATYSVQ